MSTAFLTIAVVGLIVVVWLLVRGRFLNSTQQEMIDYVWTGGRTAEELEARFGKTYEATLANLMEQGYVEATAPDTSERDEGGVTYQLTRAGEMAVMRPWPVE